MPEQKKEIDNIFAKITGHWSNICAIEEISRAKQTMGQGPLTMEERKQLSSLTAQKLSEEVFLTASTVLLWQNNETASATVRLIENEEIKCKKRPKKEPPLQ